MKDVEGSYLCLNFEWCHSVHSVTCQPIVGLRNTALLGSRSVNNSWRNTRYAMVGEAVFSSCRIVPSQTAPCIATQQAVLMSHSTTLVPRQRRCKHDLMQQSWLALFFVSLVLAIQAKRLAGLVQSLTHWRPDASYGACPFKALETGHLIWWHVRL
jgi:hypothetical protein